MRYIYGSYTSTRPVRARDRYRPLIGMTGSDDPVPFRLKKTQNIYFVRKPLKVPREEFIGHLVHCFGGQMETDVPWVPKAEFHFKANPRILNRSCQYAWVYDHVAVPEVSKWTDISREWDDIFTDRKPDKRYTDQYLKCLFRHYDARVI